MQLEEFRKTKEKELDGYFKNVYQEILDLEDIPCEYDLGERVKIFSDISDKEKEKIISVARNLKPWRKGPFEVFDTFIDTEWRSNIKFDIIKDSIDIEGKKVADIGCNNGYYLFRMLDYKPESLVGFDPSVNTYLQFLYINKFIKSDIKYELLGVEHLDEYEEKFDTIFCLGVLYHRQDPIGMLKVLRNSLEKDGEIILDTLIIKGDEDICLCPAKRYQQMRNVFFLPTLVTLENWLKRVGFKTVELITTKETTTEEQRKTEWIDGRSLDNFLDQEDSTKTVEGYPAPIRAYLKASLKG
ncbi:MAG: tRNA 5-methoxyuridine(34)/uridine 5-oxyacetic acid(34) synthase CmoB [Campylobacterales bacterium]|nr:tRNA 5-methoxyuridine(34)/uridine 5-oxyacetic acid(34) synthase CmoB [Campylobacterales bacterium]